MIDEIGMLADPHVLRNLLNERFNESELRDFCYDMGIDFESLSGAGKSDKARELIAYCERHDRTADLIGHIRAFRPVAFNIRLLALLRDQKCEMKKKLNSQEPSNALELKQAYREVTEQIRSVKSDLIALGQPVKDNPLDEDTLTSYPIEIPRPQLRSSATASSPASHYELYQMLTDYLQRMEAGLIDVEIDKLNWKPFPNANSIFVLATHSIASVEQWVCGFAGGMAVERDRDKEFTAVASNNVQELRDRFREVRANIVQVFDNLNNTRMREVIEPQGMSIGRCTVQWCIVHAIEHIAYHLGEMDTTIRFYDLMRSHPEIASSLSAKKF